MVVVPGSVESRKHFLKLFWSCVATVKPIKQRVTGLLLSLWYGQVPHQSPALTLQCRCSNDSYHRTVVRSSLRRQPLLLWLLNGGNVGNRNNGVCEEVEPESCHCNSAHATVAGPDTPTLKAKPPPSSGFQSAFTSLSHAGHSEL